MATQHAHGLGKGDILGVRGDDLFKHLLDVLYNKGTEPVDLLGIGLGRGKQFAGREDTSRVGPAAVRAVTTSYRYRFRKLSC